MAISLVTGGAGFIGSHIADALVARGHDVQWWPNITSRAGGVCGIKFDPNVFQLGADFRRCGYAVGW